MSIPGKERIKYMNTLLDHINLFLYVLPYFPTIPSRDEDQLKVVNLLNLSCRLLSYSGSWISMVFRGT